MKLADQIQNSFYGRSNKPLKYNQGFFFPLSEILTTQLKVYTDENIQSEVVPLETTETRLVSDRNIHFTIKISALKHQKRKKKAHRGEKRVTQNI